MPDNLVEFSPSAYQYPLLIKHLLHYPMVHAPDQEIVVSRSEAAQLPGVPRAHRAARERSDADRRQAAATSSPFSTGTATATTSAISPCP